MKERLYEVDCYIKIDNQRPKRLTSLFNTSLRYFDLFEEIKKLENLYKNKLKVIKSTIYTSISISIDCVKDLQSIADKIDNKFIDFIIGKNKIFAFYTFGNTYKERSFHKNFKQITIMFLIKNCNENKISLYKLYKKLPAKECLSYIKNNTPNKNNILLE